MLDHLASIRCSVQKTDPFWYLTMLFKRSPTYHVTPDRDEWVAPEETLVDAGSNLAAVEVPVGDGVFRIAYLVAVVIALVLAGAAARLTLLQHATFAQLSMRNKTVDVSVPPPRGIIMDRNGTALVQNVPSFDLLVVSRQVRRDEHGAIQGIAALARILGRNTEELALELEDGMQKNAVFFAATDIPRAQVLALTGAWPAGFSVITSTKRNYVNGPIFSHVIGYAGKVNAADIANDAYYLPSDTVGRAGIEAQYETTLRGSHGQLQFSTAQDVAESAPTAGGNLVLSIDAPTQRALWDAIHTMLQEAGLSGAAAIVQDPRDGSVLSLVSFPAYDNNLLNGSRLSPDDFSALFENPTHPLFDRVISGRYNPGSTIKPFIGMTALQEHVMTADQVVVNDCIELTVPNPQDPTHPYVYKNWRADTGPFTLDRAIADSCNIYFFTVGGGHGSFVGLGIDRIVHYLTAAHADTTLGIDLPGEDHGFVPTPDWKYATTKEPWYQGDTYNTSIGQGDLLVTPLWLNAYVSAIANGGTLWQPRVASRIVDTQHVTLQVNNAHALGQLPFSADVVRQMQTAMRRTVTGGTAHILNDLPVSAAAKTGTAEVIKGQRINSFLTVYAPADNPQIALTVLIEGSSSNQGYALRAARQFLGWYFDPARAIVSHQ
jgi:penicillin-binding protein 2